MAHFIEKCKMCKTVIRQCRCPDKNKTIRWIICSNCAKLEVDKLLQESENEDSI